MNYLRSKGAGRELLERFCVLASLPLAGTGQRERRVNRVAIPRIKSQLFMAKLVLLTLSSPPSAARGLRHRKSPFALTILADTMILAGAGSAWEGGILGSPFSIFTSERA